jgi:hypothetical protein
MRRFLRHHREDVEAPRGHVKIEAAGHEITSIAIVAVGAHEVREPNRLTDEIAAGKADVALALVLCEGIFGEDLYQAKVRLIAFSLLHHMPEN